MISPQFAKKKDYRIIFTYKLDKKKEFMEHMLLLTLQQKVQTFTCAWSNWMTGEGLFAYLVSTAERKGQTEVSVKQKPFTHRGAHDEMRASHEQVNICHVRRVKKTTTKKRQTIKKRKTKHDEAAVRLQI